jgi:hypothetical protein
MVNITNLKARLTAPKKYWKILPLEDRDPYWDKISNDLTERFIEIDTNPQIKDVLEYLISCGKKHKEYIETNVPRHNLPPGASLYTSFFLKLKPIWPDVAYYMILREMTNILIDMEFLDVILDTLDKVQNNNYTPMDDAFKLSIQKRYKEYVRRYDPRLQRYHFWFDSERVKNNQ